MSLLFFNVSTTNAKISNIPYDDLVCVELKIGHSSENFFIGDEIKNVEDGIYFGYYGFVVIANSIVVYVGENIKNNKGQNFINTEMLCDGSFSQLLKNWITLYE